MTTQGKHVNAIQREEVATERLLTVIAHHLGQGPDERSQSAGLAQRSPAMLAAWERATSRSRASDRRPRIA